MNFWFENNINISYQELITDLKNDESNYNIEGYCYFFNLLKSFVKNTKFSEVDEIINFLYSEEKKIIFSISTSGTTKDPKKIDVKLKNCIRYVKSNKSDEKKIWGMGYPVGSFASTQVFFQAFMNKESIVYLFGNDFKKISNNIAKHNVTNLSCTPTFLSMILLHTSQKNNVLNKITTGGEKTNKGLISSYKEKFTNAEYINIYATTETGSLLYSNSDLFSIPEKYNKLIIIKEGTLRVHKDLLNSSSKMEINDDWYDTKDKVEFISENKFKFISRVNGYLNTGGYRIYPSEIEDLILKIKKVKDVHVYGKENSVLGTIICADIICTDLNAKKIKSELLKITQKQKVPQIIRIVKEFEYLTNGKKNIMI